MKLLELRNLGLWRELEKRLGRLLTGDEDVAQLFIDLMTLQEEREKKLYDVIKACV